MGVTIHFEGRLKSQKDYSDVIEKAKEFLVYSSLSLEDMAFKLGFSSAPHLSRQFKSVTGMNPSQFRNIRQAKLEVSADAQAAPGK